MEGFKHWPILLQCWEDDGGLSNGLQLPLMFRWLGPQHLQQVQQCVLVFQNPQSHWLLCSATPDIALMDWHTPRAIGRGGQRGLSKQGSHVRRADRDTRMNSCGCGKGPIENAYVQGPEFCAMPMHILKKSKDAQRKLWIWTHWQGWGKWYGNCSFLSWQFGFGAKSCWCLRCILRTLRSQLFGLLYPPGCFSPDSWSSIELWHWRKYYTWTLMGRNCPISVDCFSFGIRIPLALGHSLDMPLSSASTGNMELQERYCRVGTELHYALGLMMLALLHSLLLSTLEGWCPSGALVAWLVGYLME